MKGLFYKELINSRNFLLGGTCLMLLVILGNWMSIGMGNRTKLELEFGAYLSCLVYWIVLVIAYFLFQRDEKSKWNVYVLSLPVDKPLLVKSRYLFLTCMFLSGNLIALLYSLFFGTLTEGGMLWQHLSQMAQALLLFSFFLPIAYKSGPQNSALLLFFLYVPIDRVYLAFMKIPENFLWITAFLTVLPKWSFFAVSVLVFLGSYFLSCKALRSADVF